MDRMVNYIWLAWKFTYMLKTYKTYNLMVGFSKYEFYNKLLGGIILLRVALNITCIQLLYIYIYIWVYTATRVISKLTFPALLFIYLFKGWDSKLNNFFTFQESNFKINSTLCCATLFFTY